MEGNSEFEKKVNEKIEEMRKSPYDDPVLVNGQIVPREDAEEIRRENRIYRKVKEIENANSGEFVEIEPDIMSEVLELVDEKDEYVEGVDISNGKDTSRVLFYKGGTEQLIKDKVRELQSLNTGQIVDIPPEIEDDVEYWMDKLEGDDLDEERGWKKDWDTDPLSSLDIGDEALAKKLNRRFGNLRDWIKELDEVTDELKSELNQLKEKIDAD